MSASRSSVDGGVDVRGEEGDVVDVLAAPVEDLLQEALSLAGSKSWIAQPPGLTNVAHFMCSPPSTPSP